MKQSLVEIAPPEAVQQAAGFFANALGLPHIETVIESAGNQDFLKFKVGRRAPVYLHALRETMNWLPEENPFHGLLGLRIEEQDRFPESVEADVLRGLLTRSTRTVSGQSRHMFPGQYVPFQNNEETQAIQPATHLIVGRRGVGKSTLILKAKELLDRSSNLAVILDMQPYGHRQDGEVLVDILADLASQIAREATKRFPGGQGEEQLLQFASDLLSGSVRPERASSALRRAVGNLTAARDVDLFVFLDDYHLIDKEKQPVILEAIHGGLKGARGWLKVAGLRSLLWAYDPASKKGLKSPGDAQEIKLDLTLADPAAAERHLENILLNFLNLVGVDRLIHAISKSALKRLVWANAGVPRDFLQMFSRSLEHAKRSGRKRVEVTDTNLAIGEFGQQKMDDLEGDAGNQGRFLNRALGLIEKYCLEMKKINAFLIRSEDSEEYRTVRILGDLRLVHILHQTITPHKAGERYEAYMLDYSLFTGFRRRPNIRLLLPADDKQFKASELRKIPILPRAYLQ